MTLVRPRPVRAAVGRVLALAVVTAVVTLSALVPAPAAFAHDSLTGSSPQAGAALTSAPSTVTLSFGETPMAEGLGVVVTGPDGRNVGARTPTVLDNVVVTPLVPLTTSGTYTVSWRVVAADGHPANGTFTFSLTLGSASASGSALPSSIPPAVTTAAPESTASASATVLGDVSHSPGADLTPWMVGGSALLLGVIVVLGVMGVLSRRRRT